MSSVIISPIYGRRRERVTGILSRCIGRSRETAKPTKGFGLVRVARLFPLASNLFHDDDDLAGVQALRRGFRLDVQVNLVIGYDFFLSNLITSQSIGPGNGLALDFVVGFARHFGFKAFRLLCGSGRKNLFEISNASRPKERFYRGLWCRVAGKRK